MSIDMESKGAAFKRLIESDLRDTVISLLSGLTATVAAQKDGVAVSDQHRVFNFNGAGVTVTDDPASRRTNISIPGGSAFTVTNTFDSSTASKALSLWNGSSNNAPPANWQTTGFSDAGWAAPVVTGSGGGRSSLWPTLAPLATNEQALVRQSFTLPANIAIQSASIFVGCDDYLLGVWVNGTFLSGSVQSPGALQPNLTLSIPISLLTPGAANLIAVYGSNYIGTSANQAGAYYTLTLTSTIVGIATSGALTADVTCTNANQYYDGPTVTVPAGTWLLSGTVTLYNAGAGAYINWTAKLWDGTNVFASAEQTQQSNSAIAAISLSWAVAPSVTTTYRIAAACTVAGGLIKAAALQNAAGSTASTLTAR
jgi:hypothetical protein